MAILKDLIVHGASHFIGKTFINDSHIAKINESNVPENPKFTDTIATGSVEGEGNAITDVNVDSSGNFTFTKDTTFMEPFSAQAPHTFYSGPNSGSSNSNPEFRNIILEDLPHDIEITKNSKSQNLPTTQAVAAYVDNIQVGGRNLLRNTGNLTNSNFLFPASARGFLKNSEILVLKPTTGSSAYAKFKVNYLNYGDFKEDNSFTISLDIRNSDVESSANGDIQIYCYLGVQSPSRMESSIFSKATDCYESIKIEPPPKPEEGETKNTTTWFRRSATFTLPDDFLIDNTSNSAALVEGNYITVQFGESANGEPVEIRHIKFEKGNKATDWTPAPEDLSNQIEEVKEIANTALEQNDEFITGTHSQASSTWTGATRDSILRDGKTINYKLPYTGISGQPSYLQLLLASGSSTGAIALKDNTGKIVSNQYPAGSILRLVYDASGINDEPIWRIQDTALKVEENQISAPATNDTVPTSLAVKNALNYVTPQMFGAIGDGIHDDTDAIQEALDASFNVFFPEGTYMVSYSLIVRRGSHITGVSNGKSKIKAFNGEVNENNVATVFNNETQPLAIRESDTYGNNTLFSNRAKFLNQDEVGNYIIQVIDSIRVRYARKTTSVTTISLNTNITYTKQRDAIPETAATSCFLIENLQLDCNHTRTYTDNNNLNHKRVGGVHLFRPYNQSRLQNIYIQNCTCRGIYIGDNISATYIMKNYPDWLVAENFATKINQTTYKITASQTNIINMWRRRTRSQSVSIDNCHVISSKIGYKYTPGTYYNGNAEPVSSSQGFRYVYLRLKEGSDYVYRDINNYYYFSESTQDAEKKDASNNTWLSYQTDYLGYFYNSFELNIKDTKFQYSSVNYKRYPCVVFDNCTDFFVRGCSFSGTLGQAVRIKQPTRYFRLIANTYELCGVVWRYLDDENNYEVYPYNGFCVNNDRNLHNIYRKDGDEYIPLYTERPYVISCLGEPKQTSPSKPADWNLVEDGLIMQTTYNNVPRQVLLYGTRNILIIGTFKKVASASRADYGTIIIDSVEGQIESETFDSLNLIKYYTISGNDFTTLSSGPFTYKGELALLSTEISKYGQIAGVTVAKAGGGPTTATINGSTIEVYTNSKSNHQVRVIFNKNV